MSITSFRDLTVWQKAINLTITVYRVTDYFPAQERFGLTSQLRRCAVSVPANLAEGHERHSRGAYGRHVSIAAGSLAELETQLEIAERLGYLQGENLADARSLASEVGRMLSVLLRRLRKP